MLRIDQVAMMTAIEYHGPTINKHDGEIYMLHVARVALAVSAQRYKLLNEYTATAVAWLHDTLEDTELTVPKLTSILAGHLFGASDINDVVGGVVAMTKIKGESNEAYYNRVKLNELATIVKRADMQDNFRRNHMITDDATRLRMAAKYSLGMDILG